ncbi:MAG TPA: TPM domain-containing protein [Vagococcus sp.]|uniref:TPM domain-containing protein n=1 Tax=Vagococcus fluvialis bH819 TaxID=1255619 RepID=A0A1X6WQ00_9ENTE|nr:hypothetical protein FM121_09620 [Vagococcus fluvialis bH819]HCM88990.1 TPM domain-containing protein [Vagococcus sp.]
MLGLFFILPIFGINTEAASQNVYDEAKLFTNEDIQTFEKKIKEIKEQYKSEIVIVTTNSTNDKTPEEFADNFYEQGGFGVGDTHDGMLFLIDMGTRKYHVSTTGNTIAVISNKRMQRLKESIEEDLSNNDNLGAVNTFFETTTSYLQEGTPNGYIYNKETGEVDKQKYVSPLKIIIAVVSGIAVSIVFYFSIHSKYKLKRSSYNYPYSAMSTVDITQADAVKVADFVTTRHIPKPSNNNDDFGGGSSTHMSGGGTSHGGGGGSF